MKIRISIKNKLLFYFGSIVLVGLVLSAIVSFLLWTHMIENKTEESLLQAVVRCTDRINRVLKNEEKYLEGLCENDFLQSNDHSIKEKAHYLKQMRTNNSFQEIAVVDQEGNGYTAAGEMINVKDYEVFQKALKGEVSFSNSVVIGGKEVLCLVAPLHDEKEEIIGVLIEMENVNNIRNMLESRSSINELILLDQKGAVLYHSSDEASTYPFPIEEIKASGVKRYRKPETGEMSYLAYAPLINGWSAVIVSEHATVIQPLYKYQMILFGTNVAIWIIVSMVIYLIANHIAQRVNEMTAHIHEIAMGDYMQPISNKLLCMKDEMGDAARSLQHMKREIQEMLVIMKECTNYMNEQIEDLTDDIKKTLQESVESRDVTVEEGKDVLERLDSLEKATQIIAKKQCQKKGLLRRKS